MAAAQGPTDPRLARAAAHEQRREYDQALALYRQRLAEAPSDPSRLRDAARVESYLGNATESIRLATQATQLAPDDPTYHGDLGQALQLAGHHAQALAAFERATQLDPRFFAAWCGAAQIHERLHRLAEARQCLDRALALDPRAPFPRLYLASIDRREGNLDAAQAKLESLIQESPPDEVLWRAWYELATLLDKAADTQNAMLCFQAGKAIQAKGEAPHIAEYREYLAAVHADCAGVTPAHFERWRSQANVGDAQPSSAFLVGFPRSGTTMLEQVLAAHPRAVALDERELVGGVRTAIRGLLPRSAGPTPPMAAILEALAPDVLRELRRIYFAEAENLLGQPIGDRVFVDKQPLNLLFLPEICRVFPDSPIVVALRDPRDVILSCFMQPWQTNRITVNFLTLERAAHLYANVMSVWLRLRESIKSRFVEVRYEDTTLDLEAQSRRVLDTLGLPFDPAVLSFHTRAREQYVKTPSYQAVTAPVNRNAVGRWKKYEEHFASANKVLAPFLRSFGYA